MQIGDRVSAAFYVQWDEFGSKEVTIQGVVSAYSRWSTPEDPMILVEWDENTYREVPGVSQFPVSDPRLTPVT